MKKITVLVLMLFTALSYAQVGVNTNNPHASAALDITSTTGGLLVPRMTAAERDEITSATQGLIIFCTDCASGEGELQVKLTSSWKKMDGGDVNDPPPQVGDFYGGGVVFYIFESGDTGYVVGETHGLIAAVENQSSGIQWYNGSNVVTGATAVAVGMGSANTDAIITAQGAPETSYAAGLARAYTGGGYTDWYLPSKDELNKMYENRATINTTAASNSGSNFSENNYWSSTEYDNDNAWRRSFKFDNRNYVIKIATSSVRAVRAF